MQVIQSLQEMQGLAIEMRGKGKLLGLVPTMGALHEGHLSLIDICREKADVTIVSIFLNPTQFGPNEDLDSYPQPLEEDLEACKARGADIVFAPARGEVYPKDYSTYINEELYSRGMCGTSRPGHFRGVTTVVAILFNICRPDVAVFGQKDGQQVAIIRKMVRDLHFPVEIVTGPTVREPDGLAMSSRNRYLDSVLRRESIKLYNALMEGKKLVDKGFLNVNRITAEVTHYLSQTHLIRIIYIEVVDKETMLPEQEIRPGKSMLAAAIWLDQTRLIDNLEL
ncbi:pantoate--beta-alanine ligase [Rubellicoccus peritrichatus]|uniref:Pantothenate synthetase n=1 Tax=Rubellicoccus peritrichatus TaxID=3080537 RepID=A0AAQ3LBU0_9BACT|nr:pantoate--beta-alanine ligase [Puniceicoccus sp. CR14]WOO42521.1 pantoate--beta-alanine ligase [Puniceicoccus sp. CR14]